MSIIKVLLKLKNQHKEGTKEHAALEWAVLTAVNTEQTVSTFETMCQEVDRAKEEK